MINPFTIVLDPGHGGTELADGSTPNNAVGANGLLEKDMTLKIVNGAAALLPADRFRVILTRIDDRNLSLAERAKKSRESGADAFISVHFNAARDVNVDGTEVFVSNAGDENDTALANELLKRVSAAANIQPLGIRRTDFTVLGGDYHVAKTAACLIEVAYLTNAIQAKKLASPEYVNSLSAAVANSVDAYERQLPLTRSLASEGASEKSVAKVKREHADPKNFPIDLPEPGKGTDAIKISIPDGLKFSRWEVEVLASSAAAGYKVVKAPKTGAEGDQTFNIDWWHLPYGKISYKLNVYASPDGKSFGDKVVFNSSGWMEKAKDQISQGVPLRLAVKGEKAKQIYDAMQTHQAQKQAQQAGNGGVAIAMEPITITVVILVGIVIFGILVALGLIMLGTVIKMALDKGYDVKDTKYKAGVGEGQLRQDHEIAFNITKPK